MSRDKLLAEWFWIERWDGSPAAALPLLARGLYREMLTRAWRLGGWLPNDHGAIQRLVRVTPAEWRKAWPLVSPYWREDGARIVNDTQLEVMAEARRRREEASEHGRRAANARHGQASGTARADARAVPEHQPPSPSPSPTPTEQQHAGGVDGGPLPKRCPDCGEFDTLIRLDRRADLAASWVCSHKAGGCGAGHALDRPEILAQMSPRARAATEARAAADRARFGGGGRRDSRLQDYGPIDGPQPGTPEWDAAAAEARAGVEEARRELEASRRTCDHERLARMRSTTGKPRVCFVCQAEIRPERVSA